MFWNQVACLVGTVRQCSGAPAVGGPLYLVRLPSYTLQGVIFEDILEWSTGVRYSSFEADDMRIFVEINPSATVRYRPRI
jgi:hypothetical protein